MIIYYGSNSVWICRHDNETVFDFMQQKMVEIWTQRMKRMRTEKQPLKQSITETSNIVDEDGVFMDILSRLPVKSILSFKTLSKYWNSSISSTYFYKMQLAQSRKKQSYIVCPTMEKTMKLYSMDSRSSFKLSPLSTINPHERSHEESMYMITSFHGLICCVNLISDENVGSKFCDLQIRICNPCTGETLLLPQGTPSFEIEPSVGVAYDSNISDYRIFRIFCTGERTPEEKLAVVGYEYREGLLVAKYQYALAYECEVYSSITGCWKNIGSVPCIPDYSSLRPYRTGHIFVGVKIYWLVSVEEPSEILSVDLEGRFEVINLPEYSDFQKGEDQIEDSTHLINLQGSLALLVQHPGWMDIWVREDEGEKGSWVLKLTDHMPIKDDDEVVFAVTSLKNQIMCVAEKHWYVYDVETGIWKKKRGPCTGIVNPAVFPFTESILPCQGGVPL